MIKLLKPTIDTPSLKELIEYLSKLESGTVPQWGTMNSTQMCRHCNNFIELYLGKVKVSVIIRFLARIIGSIFLKKILSKSPKNTPKNLKTLPSIRVNTEELDYITEHSSLINSLENIVELKGIIEHPLYGKMTSTDVISLIRHHTAHHFHQFSLLSNNKPSHESLKKNNPVFNQVMNRLRNYNNAKLSYNLRTFFKHVPVMTNRYLWRKE